MKKLTMMLLVFCCVVGVMAFGGTEKEIDIKMSIDRQLQDFPQSRLQDIYKSFYQSYFGAEHLITDTMSVRAYLREEIAVAATDTVANPYYEPTGGHAVQKGGEPLPGADHREGHAPPVCESAAAAAGLAAHARPDRTGAKAHERQIAVSDDPQGKLPARCLSCSIGSSKEAVRLKRSCFS